MAEKKSKLAVIKTKPTAASVEDFINKGRVGKGISAQASHRTVLETLTSHGSSHSA